MGGVTILDTVKGGKILRRHLNAQVRPLNGGESAQALKPGRP